MINFIVFNELLESFHPNLAHSDFAKHALSLLRVQALENPVYRRFLAGLKLDPQQLQNWEDFPALPVGAFREQPVCCFPPDQAKLIFETSGTTAAKTGRHYFNDARYYEKSLLAGFQMFMPDLSGHHWISLIPSFAEKPNSSLGYMVDYLGRMIPKQGCKSFCNAAFEIDYERFEKEFDACSQTGQPVALFGTSFALATIGEVFQERGRTWKLAPESVIFDTGGYKGRRRELTTDELIQLMVSVLGFSAQNIYNEYGMTELSTPGYTRLVEGIHRFPPWLKVLIRNPQTGRICKPGEKGLVQLYDLANVGSVMAIATLDIAVYEQDGIRLLGRVNAADLRGCSLPYEV